MSGYILGQKTNPLALWTNLGSHELGAAVPISHRSFFSKKLVEARPLSEIRADHPFVDLRPTRLSLADPEFFQDYALEAGLHKYLIKKRLPDREDLQSLRFKEIFREMGFDFGAGKVDVEDLINCLSDREKRWEVFPGHAEREVPLSWITRLAIEALPFFGIRYAFGKLSIQMTSDEEMNMPRRDMALPEEDRQILEEVFQESQNPDHRKEFQNIVIPENTLSEDLLPLNILTRVGRTRQVLRPSSPETLAENWINMRRSENSKLEWSEAIHIADVYAEHACLAFGQPMAENAGFTVGYMLAQAGLSPVNTAAALLMEDLFRPYREFPGYLEAVATGYEANPLSGRYADRSRSLSHHFMDPAFRHRSTDYFYLTGMEVFQ